MYILNPKVTTKITEQIVIANNIIKEIKQNHKNKIQKTEIQKKRNKEHIRLTEIKQQDGRFKTNHLITLNVSGLNVQIKSQRFLDWIKSKIQDSTA